MRGVACLWSIILPSIPAEQPAFFQAHCTECHDKDAHKGNLDLTSLKPEFADKDTFARWVKVYDRIQSGEMPPKKKERPPANDLKVVSTWLNQALVTADRARLEGDSRTAVRRLTRGEYENTVRDLFGLDGIPLRDSLPADGTAHGFDTNSEALDISHVNMAKYVETADAILDMAIATQPQAPPVAHERLSLGNTYIVETKLMTGSAVLLKDKQPDPAFPPSGQRTHVSMGEHERAGLFNTQSSVGIFEHENETFNPSFIRFAALHPGRYRIRASAWSFQWDKGKVLPARGTEAARLSVVQLAENGRHGTGSSFVLGYFDAPSLQDNVYEITAWLNRKDTIGFNAASLVPVRPGEGKGRALAFTGSAVASDWLEIEGPFHEVWPPASHRILFGDLPMAEFKPADLKGVRPPEHPPLKQEILHARNRPAGPAGFWTVASPWPLNDADRLFASFLPKLFRRPVEDEIRKQYAARVSERMREGDCFESAMRWAYRAALCSPDFLYHVEPFGKPDDFTLANRLSYFLWNSLPDEALTKLAASGKLHDPKMLKEQVERLLKDPKSQRFIDDFLGQWLKLRAIAANDPDKKLYPEFSPYLQDSMVAETRAYFRELIEKNLPARYLVKSDFAMLNEKLATHYGIAGVTGSAIRRVALPVNHPRGGFLTQAAILKVTANGTTTSPVVRGAFVMARLLGQPPEPPPPNIPAVEPDVQGATTIREQLDKHRADASCASCHVKMDPPGFALESFDVIGGQRDRYRAIRDKEKDDPPAPRGNLDPFINISFKLGPPVDPSGVFPDDRKFKDITELQTLLAADEPRLLKNLAEQLIVYSTGREIAFSERQEVASLLQRTQKQGGGIRALLHEIVQSPLFQTK